MSPSNCILSNIYQISAHSVTFFQFFCKKQRDFRIYAVGHPAVIFKELIDMKAPALICILSKISCFSLYGIQISTN